MKRRDFLKLTAATAVTATAGPIILGAENKSGTEHPIIGVEGHKYECHHNWGTLPGDLEWQTTHNIAVDSQGQVYVTHQGHKGMKGLDTTFVFDAKGKFVKSFGKDWHGGGHGIDFRMEDGNEYLYLTNTWTSPKVVKMDMKGETVWKLERPLTKEYEDTKKPYSPTNVAFCPNGDFFIGDGYGSHYMLKYTKDGKFISIFGGVGKADGKFTTPHGNWIDDRNKEKPTLVVCDRANFRLQTFDLDGKHISTTEKGIVLFPAHIDIRGDVMMVSDLHTRISLFGKDGKVITHLGEDKEWFERVVTNPKRLPAARSTPKDCPAGKFIHPHDACFDKDGNIYVAEWVQGGRITFLKKV